jgi:YD repeat-containing protein
VIASVDGLGNRVTFGFDNAGRQVTVQDARGHVYTIVYNVLGRTQAAVSPLGYMTTQQYDAARRNTAAHSGANRTLIPGQTEHGFRGYLNAL